MTDSESEGGEELGAPEVPMIPQFTYLAPRQLLLPRYNDKLPEPSLARVTTDAEAAKVVLELKNEALHKHRKALEANTVVSERLYEKIVGDLAWLVVERFRKPGGVDSVKRMVDAFGLLPDVQLDTFDIKNPVRVACECVVLSAFCKLVKAPNYIPNCRQLMEQFSNFEVERTQWWRKRPAHDRHEAQYQEKLWDDLLRDLPALLKFYNAAQHLHSLEPKYKTGHLCAITSMTTDGEIVESGGGRKVKAECRLIIVLRVTGSTRRESNKKRADGLIAGNKSESALKKHYKPNRKALLAEERLKQLEHVVGRQKGKAVVAPGAGYGYGYGVGVAAAGSAPAGTGYSSKDVKQNEREMGDAAVALEHLVAQSMAGVGGGSGRGFLEKIRESDRPSAYGYSGADWAASSSSGQGVSSAGMAGHHGNGHATGGNSGQPKNKKPSLSVFQRMLTYTEPMLANKGVKRTISEPVPTYSIGSFEAFVAASAGDGPIGDEAVTRDDGVAPHPASGRSQRVRRSAMNYHDLNCGIQTVPADYSDMARVQSTRPNRKQPDWGGLSSAGVPIPFSSGGGGASPPDSDGPGPDGSISNTSTSRESRFGGAAEDGAMHVVDRPALTRNESTGSAVSAMSTEDEQAARNAALLALLSIPMSRQASLVSAPGMWAPGADADSSTAAFAAAADDDDDDDSNKER